MRRVFTSSLLSLLLLTTLVWGGCISCEEYFMWPGAKSCCTPDGRCKTKTPHSQNSNRECNLIAFDHHKAVDLHIELPVVAVIRLDPPVRRVQTRNLRHGANPVEPSPPDLQILHSVFLI